MSEREPQRQRMILTEDGELLGIEPEDAFGVPVQLGVVGLLGLA